MKKFFKILGIFLLIIAAGVAVLFFTGDKDYNVTRTQTIKVPVELVYAKVSDFNEFNSFNPWYDLDESQKTEVIGYPNSDKHEFHWDSKNNEVGKGKMEITSVKPNENVDMKLTFYSPFENSTNCGFDLAKKGEMETSITWYLRGENDAMGKIMSNFMSMDDMIGSKYEKGLEKLRAELEGK